MSNKLIVAAAGSGKTTHLVSEALKIADKKVLMTTFTDANENEIRKKFYEIKGYIPSNITIQTWFSFLIQHGVKPYQSVVCNAKIKGLMLVNQKSGLRGYNKVKKPIYFGENDPINYYFSKSQLIYSDKIAKFAVRANELTKGLVIERIGKIYSSIFIDEIQDMAGYDLEIIKFLFGLNSDVLLVGDPRQVTYHTHDETKYSQYADGAVKEFIEKECKGFPVEIDDTTLNKTSVYKGYKQDKIEMRGDRAEMSDFPLYLNTVAGGLDRRDQTIGGFSFVVKIYAVPVVEIIG